MPPDAATDGSCRPSRNNGRIIDLYADNPTTIRAAISGVAGIRHVDDTIHSRECAALVLD